MMDVAGYLERRRAFEAQAPKYRVICSACRQPDFTCYCAHVRPFDPKIGFVILIHPLEAKRRIATGRMSHLCLKSSHLILGYDYSESAELNRILQDPQNHCMILYPGRQATNLTLLEPEARGEIFPSGKRPMIIVIDGTWNTARKMLRLSRNLHGLPRVCFTPPRPSTFRVRQQPKAECYSTLESIHHVIELTGHACGFDVESRAHDRLLFVFDKMVEQQLEFIRTTHQWRKRSRHYQVRE